MLNSLRIEEGKILLSYFSLPLNKPIFPFWVIFTMGFPLVPVLANLFMGHHEKRWLENCNSGIEFYRRYVDDTFALFNTEQEALSFFSYINSQHPNIKFTMEREGNQKLPFLDVLLDNHSNQGIITSVFHKKTYTGLLTNYFSLVPFSYKLGLVRTLVDRIFKINNTSAGFHLDINNLIPKRLGRTCSLLVLSRMLLENF